MPRQKTPAPVSRETAIATEVVAQDFDAANRLGAMQQQANTNAVAVAAQIGYQGALTVGTLEDEIRFYQRRTVEAILETGKRLLVLKELTPHGEFKQRVEILGFSDRTAQRFMQAAAKTAKSANLADLSTKVKSASAFLELVTHDEDVLENLAEMDEVDKMSASELRESLREARSEKQAVEEVLAGKNEAMDKLRAQVKRIAKQAPDEALADLQREATGLMNDAVGAIRGGLRGALIAIKNHGDEDHTIYMAGLVGQVSADLAALREEFGLPDLAATGDAQLAAEVKQWAQ